MVLVGCGPSVDIHQACRGRNIEAVKQYLAAGWDVNAKGKYGKNPLHLAAIYDHKEIAELLIAEGADVNAKARDGRTPLDWAGLGARVEIAAFLGKHGGKTKKELKAAGN